MDMANLKSLYAYTDREALRSAQIAGRLDAATASRNSSRARENGLFGVGSYNYEELQTSPRGPDGLRQQQGSIPLWVTIVTSAAFGVLAAGCVFWSGLAHRRLAEEIASHTLVSSMGRTCKGKDCTTAPVECRGAHYEIP
eukprot:s5970_g1.t1